MNFIQVAKEEINLQIEANVRLINRDTGLKGVADITFDKAFVIKGIFIRQGNNGLYLTYPNYKNGDKYKSHCYPITADCRQKIIDKVLTAYNQKLSAAQVKEKKHGKKVQTKASNDKTQTNTDTKAQKNSSTSKEQEVSMTLEM